MKVCSSKIEELRVRFDFEGCFSMDRLGRGGELAVLYSDMLLLFILMCFSRILLI